MKLITCDDHALFRSGLRAAIEELEPGSELREAATAKELFVLMADASDVDLVLLDLGLPDLGGLALLERVRNEHPAIPVVVVSGSDDQETIRGVLALGAMGFIPKSVSGPVLVGALRLVLAGGVYVPPELVDGLQSLQSETESVRAVPDVPSDASDGARRFAGLTARQREVVELIAKGLTDREVAKVLGIAHATAKHHAAAAYAALDVSNRTEAALLVQSVLAETS